MKVRALQRFEYSQRMVQAGDEIDMDESHATALRALGKVENAASAEAPEINKRRYNRRDMKASR